MMEMMPHPSIWALVKSGSMASLIVWLLLLLMCIPQEVQSPPQTLSVIINEEGLVSKYTVGYVNDKEVR